jgi:hypothetical protein
MLIFSLMKIKSDYPVIKKPGLATVFFDYNFFCENL